jgi:two-component system NtrC family sensor kinase
MVLPDKLKPRFWEHVDVATGPYRHLFNFRRIWKMAVFLTAAVTLIPLLAITWVDYRVTRNSLEYEILLQTARVVSNTRRTIWYFLIERKAAIDFIVQDNSYATLTVSTQLSRILENLKKGFGGFLDLGVIDSSGCQCTYVGPYQLEGKNYRDQPWFQEVLHRGIYISDVFLGFRHVPHIVIAVKHNRPDGSFFVLRASLDTERFNNLLTDLELAGRGDAFIVNHRGVLQTPSRYHGSVLDKINLPLPVYSEKTEVREIKAKGGGPLIIGYRYLPETPFILMVVKQKNELMKSWQHTRWQLIGFLIGSITIILLVIIGGATYLVNRIFLADQRRVMILHEVEYANKMASIGRLAAGVAHEINNPLAIINEKAGLIRDLFTFKQDYAHDSKLMGLVDSVIASVGRCAKITRRLLTFARHEDLNIRELDLGEVVQEVLGFLGKEADYRSIDVSIDAADNMPPVESDRGRLQEIFLNIVNNAFAAVEEGGRIRIKIRPRDSETATVSIEDNGQGIPAKDLDRVFEPFFSTKTRTGGTGLGLSITYGLVREIGGKIEVQSEVGKGTCFVVTLPLKQKAKSIDS